MSDEIKKAFAEEFRKIIGDKYDENEVVAVEMTRMEWMLIMASEILMRKGGGVALDDFENTGTNFMMEPDESGVPLQPEDFLKTLYGISKAWEKFSDKLVEIMPPKPDLEQSAELYDQMVNIRNGTVH